MRIRRVTRQVMAIVCMCMSGLATADDQNPTKQTFREVHMGVDVTLTLYGGTEAAANDAARLAYTRVAELNQIFSDYDPESEAMRLCREAAIGQVITISPDLYFVLDYADGLSRKSAGAFDVTIGPVSKLWRRARRRYQLPDSQELAEALERVGRNGYQLNPAEKSVSLLRNDLQMDFGGVVKGYAAEAAYRSLQEHGFRQSMVAVAGDLFVGDAPPGQLGWRIGIAPLEAGSETPSRWLCLQQAAVSTSGDAFQFVEIDGTRYSHIVDPRTGLGLTQRCSITVVAKQGHVADSLATTACVLGPQTGLALLQKTPDVHGLFVTRDDRDGRVVTAETANFSELECAEPPKTE